MRSKKSTKSQTSINEKMPAMLLVILLLLMVQLQHFGKTLMVVATGPLGLIGAATALLVLQAPFGFVAILGVIALAGIIMRNSVILVDQNPARLGGGARCVHRDRRIGGPPIPANHAHGCGGRSGPDPACSRGVLGADGAGYDGRANRSDRPDADISACRIRTCVPSCSAARSFRAIP